MRIVTFDEFKQKVSALPENQGATELQIYNAWDETFGKPQRQAMAEADGPVAYSVDQAQKMLGAGVRTIGQGTGLESVENFGQDVIDQQDQDIKAGNYQSQYKGSFRDNLSEGGITQGAGWAFEKALENVAYSGGALAGGALAAVTAPLSVPLSIAIGGATVLGSGLGITGETALEMEEKGVDVSPGLAIGAGVIGGTLERFGLGRLFPSSKLAGMTGKELVTELAEKGHKDAAKIIAKEIVKRSSAEIGAEVGQEGTIVGASALAGSEYEADELIDRAIDTMVVAGTLTTPYSMAGTIRDSITPTPEVQPEPVKTLEELRQEQLLIEESLLAQAEAAEQQAVEAVVAQGGDALDAEFAKSETRREYSTDISATAKALRETDKLAQTEAERALNARDELRSDIEAPVTTQIEPATIAKPVERTELFARQTEQPVVEVIEAPTQETAAQTNQATTLKTNQEPQPALQNRDRETQDMVEQVTDIVTQPAQQQIIDPAQPSLVDIAATEAALSPSNDLPEPTEAQKEAGNYKVGRVKIAGLDISIENPKGSLRKGTDKTGTPWENEMQSHYGYVRGSVGRDKDHVDVFLGEEAENAEKVFVIDQVDPDTGKFDEHKVMIGYPNELAARRAYASNYNKDWKGLGNITEMPMDEFKSWVKDPKLTSKPITKIPQPLMSQGFASGRKAKQEGAPRELPEYIANKTGKNAKEWLKGWDGTQSVTPISETVEQEAPVVVAAPAEVPETVSANDQQTGDSSEDLNEVEAAATDINAGQGGAVNTQTATTPAEQNDPDESVKKPGKESGQSNDSQETQAVESTEKTADNLPDVKPETETESRTSQSSTPIEDFGEKILGARKDFASKMADAKEKDIAAVPLSESWPEPDYQGLVDNGADKMAVGFARALREEIPSKPRVSWKLKGWSETVENSRDIAERIVAGEIDVAELRQKFSMSGIRASARMAEYVFGRAELYAELGHEKSLKGLKFYKAHYAVLKVGEGFEKDVTKWVIERPSGASNSFSNMPYNLASAETKEAALDQFRKIYSELGQKKEAKAVRFDIYTSRRDKEDVFIGKKIGRDVVRIQDGFKTVNEARLYRTENQEALEKKLERMKDVPDMRKETNAPRVGIDHRNGGDVTPEQFSEGFGFRGVQFGNYVEQGKRQQDLNDAYDALMDLAGILNIPPKALSLNGELGLAFGARGKGGKRPAKAHYESGNVVINLTKKSGAGSLAHEWWHSLDNYFSRQGGGDGFVTDNPYSKLDGVRPEVISAFKEVNAAINRTKLRQRSEKLDATRTKPYWGTNLEMSARSFESYTIEKLNDQGASSDYVANIVSEDYWNAAANLGIEKDGTYPYPEAAEVPEIRAAFDNFFEVVETKETDQGVALYSQGDGDGLSLTDAETILNQDKRLARAISKGKLKVVQSGSDIPESASLYGSDDAIQGAYLNGTAYVVADGNSEQSINSTAWHELTHAAIDAQGDTFVTPEVKQKLFKRLDNQVRLARNSKQDSPLKRAVARAEKAGTSDAKFLEEVAGYLVTGYVNQSDSLSGSIRQWVQDLIAAIQSAVLRFSGIQVGSVTGAELNAIAKAYADYVTLSDRGRGEGVADAVIPEGEASILYSKPAPANTMGPSNFAAPEENLLATVITKMQDKFKVLKDLQANIKKSGGTVTETNDAYRAEELFHGKAENDIRLMREQFIEPLVKVMAESDIDQASLDQYLYAKHAPERNAQIAKINPAMKDGGSGMTNAEAAAVIAKVSESGKQNQYDAAAGLVYEMLQTQRDMIRDNQLEEDGVLDAWESAYEFYVPLKGWSADTEGDGIPATGSGFNIGGKETKRALGRSTEAASPSSYAISDTTRMIIRKRKNEVGNALLKLIEDNPNKAYWQVFTDDNPETDRRLMKVKDPETGEMVEQVRETAIPMAMLRDRYFTTKRDGKVYYMKLEDERLMRAMKNLGPETNNILLRTLGGINRILSALNTSYSPEFVISNFSRDIQTAILNLQAEQSLEYGKAFGQKIGAKTVKDTPIAMRAIYASLRNKTLKGKAAKWQEAFDDFRAAGAKTGYFDMKDLNGQARELEQLITMAKGGIKGNALKFAKQSAEVVENINQAVENAVRLSAYVNALEAGISKSQAASLAKNMTVNFNRRGEIGTLLNSLYMFANASIQGTANFARTMLTFKGDGSIRFRNMNNAQRIAAGIVAGSYFLGMLNRLIAGDDDDGENWYNKVPDYVKERNIVIMKSMFGGEENGEYWKIPLPYGYNVFSVMGTGMESVFSGAKSPVEASSEMVLAVMGSFSPIGFQESGSVQGVLLKNAAPTVVKPIVDIALNENFMGSSIYNENFPFGTPKPDSSLARRSTPAAYKALTTWLNETTGGSEYRPGAIDINPDVLNYITDYFGGSAYSFFGTKTPDFGIRTFAGIDMEAHKTPFISRISGKVLPYEDQDKFYDRRNEINQLVSEYKAISGAERLKFSKQYGAKIRLAGLIKQTEAKLKLLRKRRDNVYAQDIPMKQRDLQLKAIETEMKAAIDKFNKEYAKASDR